MAQDATQIGAYRCMHISRTLPCQTHLLRPPISQTWFQCRDLSMHNAASPVISARPQPSPLLTTSQSERFSIQPCDEESLYRYTSGRWLWNEGEQLSRRYVKFNLGELARVATEATGSRFCVQVQKLPEGNFSKVFLMTMDNGREVIAKLPNPNAGRQHFTTASEVATMDYVRNILNVPAPKVYAFSSSADNPVGAEYIIMERSQGVELSKHWDEIRGPAKFEIVKQLVQFEKSLSSSHFPMYGSLYYAKDLPGVSPGQIIQSASEDPAIKPVFAVGPTTNRTLFDDGRDAVSVDRGPWASLEDYMLSRAQRELACLQMFSTFPGQQGLFYGPRQYQPRADHKRKTLQDYMKALPFLLPKDEEVSKPVLWHPDLHADNIFVNPNNPTEIVSVIDWQAVNLSPLFLQARHPRLIEFDGPIPEGLQSIELPDNFEQLSPEEQLEAKKLRAAQSLYKLYEIQLIRQCPEIYRALQFRDSLPVQIMGLSGSIFSDGEPVVEGMLMRLEEQWSTHVGSSVPCPLSFSELERDRQREDEALWNRSVVLMDEFLTRVGAYRGWDGWVYHDNYDRMKRHLERCKGDFLDGHCVSEEEKSQWGSVWPFTDTPDELETTDTH